VVAPNPERVLSALRQAAAEIIMPRFRKLADGEVRSKGGKGNLVTVADEESERFLTQVLAAEVPGAHVVGEEAVAANPSVLEALGREEWIWVVDPVDGTANFVAGTSIFCSMLALLHRGEAVMSFIYRPVDGDALVAERGAGTVLIDYAERSKRLTVPTPGSDELSTMVAALYNKDLASLKGKFARISRSGCAGHDYWNGVEGHYQVIAFRRLQPWDHAPGDLLYREAGGHVRMMSGARYEPAAPNQSGILATPNADIWNKIAELARLIGNRV
jgi:fructose-1,6-bisphosphatase/inositol monophosphatase family enzyme